MCRKSGEPPPAMREGEGDRGPCIWTRPSGPESLKSASEIWSVMTEGETESKENVSQNTRKEALKRDWKKYFNGEGGKVTKGSPRRNDLNTREAASKWVRCVRKMKRERAGKRKKILVTNAYWHCLEISLCYRHRWKSTRLKIRSILTYDSKWNVFLENACVTYTAWKVP